MGKKVRVVMDLSSSGKGGGPYTSSIRVMNSGLKDKYDFKVISYKTELGRFISIKRILDLRRQLIDLKPNIVHFTGLQLSGFHVALACVLAGIRNTVVTVHGFSGDSMNLSLINKFLLNCIIEPLTLLMVKRVYGVSQFVASRKMMKLFSYKSCGFIYNLPPDKYKSENYNDDVRKELGVSPNDILAISVGRVTLDKGYHILSDAILQFQNTPHLKFVIVGKGNYLSIMKEKLKEQIASGQVIVLGHRDDVQRIVHTCDFFILPTLHETLSIALLEASIEEIALIGSDTGGVPEIIKNQYNGILVPPGETDALVSAINQLYQNDELRMLYSKNALIHVRQQFNKRQIEESIDTVYKELLD